MSDEMHNSIRRLHMSPTAVSDYHTHIRGSRQLLPPTASTRPPSALFPSSPLTPAPTKTPRKSPPLVLCAPALSLYMKYSTLVRLRWMPAKVGGALAPPSAAPAPRPLREAVSEALSEAEEEAACAGGGGG